MIRPIMVNQCICMRCGHIWTSELIPVRCAKCRSQYWNLPKQKKGKKPARL